jgi:hypothetical protein
VACMTWRNCIIVTATRQPLYALHYSMQSPVFTCCDNVTCTWYCLVLLVISRWPCAGVCGRHHTRPAATAAARALRGLLQHGICAVSSDTRQDATGRLLLFVCYNMCSIM